MHLFHSDPVAKIMTFLILLIGFSVCKYSINYLQGDQKYKKFFIKVLTLMGTVVVFVNADNLLLFWSAWVWSNLLLVSLMIHKPNWKAAKQSGLITLKDFGLGALFLGGAFTILYQKTGMLSISKIVNIQMQANFIKFSLILILLAAMTQSSIWPLHRWLISSLNSPTPVSAIMHAGLLNGGGFLLIRFAPLYLKNPELLNIIFVLGLISAVMGTFWKLMQNDIKRMLACSTMGQMGFTFLQCGLGLFPAAVAHLVYHGMFKAYLFLNSSSAAQEKRLDLAHPVIVSHLIISIIFGFVGSLVFGYFADKSWFILDANLILLIVAFISTSQIAMHTMLDKGIINLIFSLAAAVIFGGVYGWSVNLITLQMSAMNIMQPQPLNIIHGLAVIVFLAPWILTLIFKIKSRTFDLHPILAKTYVFALNASQPHPKTVTAIRNQYSYK
jgi:NAD(P)H-quinone oxidoreductase subunit 5